MTIRGRAGFATWFSRVSPEERGVSVARRGRRMAAGVSAWIWGRGKRGADGRLLAVIVRNRRARHHCVYLTADIAGKCTQSLARIGAVIKAVRDGLPLAYSCIYDIQSLHLT